jgi:hypothetical protein
MRGRHRGAGRPWGKGLRCRGPVVQRTVRQSEPALARRELPLLGISQRLIHSPPRWLGPSGRHPGQRPRGQRQSRPLVPDSGGSVPISHQTPAASCRLFPTPTRARGLVVSTYDQNIPRIGNPNKGLVAVVTCVGLRFRRTRSRRRQSPRLPRAAPQRPADPSRSTGAGIGPPQPTCHMGSPKALAASTATHLRTTAVKAQRDRRVAIPPSRACVWGLDHYFRPKKTSPALMPLIIRSARRRS